MQNLLVPREASRIFQRAASGAGEQPRRRIIFVAETAGDDFESVKPAVTEVVLIERRPRPCGEKLV
jgi:hypothetical protein